MLRGNPEQVFERILKEWDIKFITFESDIEPYSVKRDELVEQLARKHKVELLQCTGHTLLNPAL